MKYQINQNQCGFLLKDGCFVKTLYCGTYHYMKAFGYEVVIEEMEGLVGFSGVPKEILLKDQELAAKVLEISDKIIAENGLTAMMVTHNMKDAIAHGNRLIMMHEGRIIYDVSGEEKKKLSVADLLAKFEEASGGEFANDRMLLT